ncbi:hypothetical protein AAHB57_07010 [Bacillus cereus]
MSCGFYYVILIEFRRHFTTLSFFKNSATIDVPLRYLSSPEDKFYFLTGGLKRLNQKNSLLKSILETAVFNKGKY